MDYLQDFLDFCKFQRGLADNSLDSYRWEVSQYLEWLKDRSLAVEAVRIKDIDDYLLFLKKEKDNTVKTANHKMYCLKTFYRWLQRIEVITANPLDVFQNTKTPKLLPHYLTEAEQKRLINASKNGYHRPLRMNWLRKRDYLMVLFFLDTGLRVAELCSIEIKDFDLKHGVLRVMGKGSKEREVILSDRVIKALRAYLRLAGQIILNQAVGPGLPARGFNLSAICRKAGVSLTTARTFVERNKTGWASYQKLKKYVDENIRGLPLKYLFFNQGGRKMNTRHVFRIIQEIGERAGIEGVHPHLLRHSYATNLRRKGADLLLVKEALGHASVITTEMYAHLADTEYRRKIRSLIN
jgi:integrase/recombinase XerD